MALQDRLRETLRIAILRLMEQLESRAIDEDLLSLALRDLDRETHSDTLRAELTWLERQGLIRVNRPGDEDEAWVAHLTERGDLCARGVTTEPGVARPRRG